MYLRKNIPLFIGIIMLFTTSGCLTVQQDQAWVKPLPLGREIESYKPSASDSSFPADADVEKINDVLTLKEALKLALLKNPELQAFSLEVRAKEAAALQAGLHPNPQIETEVEDFGGTGPANGFDSSETTVQLSQLVLLGGKISKRKSVAALETRLAGWDYETVRIDVLTETTKAFINVVSAQKRLELNTELFEVAIKVYETISRLSEAGEISPIEEKRASVALSKAQIKLDRAERNLKAAKKKLASLWGSTGDSFKKVKGELDSVSPVPEFNQLSDLISQNPDVARWTTEMEKRSADLNLEKAKSIPDFTLRGGPRWLSSTDDVAFIVGISVPLQLFDRNQGNIAKARHSLAKGEKLKESAEITAYSNLSTAYQNLSSAYEETVLLRNKVLPRAKEAYELIFEGYRQGKFVFLDVLDAQRTFFDAKLQYLEALSDYHSFVAEVERLTGTPLEDIKNSTDNANNTSAPDSTFPAKTDKENTKSKRAGEIK